MALMPCDLRLQRWRRRAEISSYRPDALRAIGTSSQKIWNAARFTQINGCTHDEDFDPGSCELTVNKWIVGETVRTSNEISAALEAYRFNEAAQTAYQFVWHQFCDWYLEFTKPILNDGDPLAKKEVRATTSWVFDQLLKFLHPIMPFVTEELWDQLAPKKGRKGMLMEDEWPELEKALRAPDTEDELGWLIRMISAIRTVRSEMNVPPKTELNLIIVMHRKRHEQRLIFMTIYFVVQRGWDT